MSIRKSTITISILSILLGLSLLFTYIGYKYHIRSQTRLMNKAKGAYLAIENSYIETLRYSKFSFTDSIQLSPDISQVQQIKELISTNRHHKVLVCRFFEYNCESCIESMLDRLRIYSDLIGSDNILVIVGYKNTRVFKVQSSLYHIDNLTLFNTGVSNFPSDIACNPYLFILDKDLQAYNLFFPNKQYPLLTDFYLQTIRGLYFLDSK